MGERDKQKRRRGKEKREWKSGRWPWKSVGHTSAIHGPPVPFKNTVLGKGRKGSKFHVDPIHGKRGQNSRLKGGVSKLGSRGGPSKQTEKGKPVSLLYSQNRETRGNAERGNVGRESQF